MSAVAFAPPGQEAAMESLRELWAKGTGPRTLLFAGPPGVGQYEAALWFLAYLNCGSSGERPCGHCPSCTLVRDGAHPDFKAVWPSRVTGSGRLKQAPELRIDQLVPRERGEAEPLGPWLFSRPRFERRVGVIGDAETMNQAAANSILKILEEPPAWSTVLLLAPGPDALLPTVASRATTVRFTPVDPTKVPALSREAGGHPAVRLGRPGLLPHDAVAAEAARAAAEGLLASVAGPLAGVLAAAEELTKAVTDGTVGEEALGPLGWLRELTRAWGPAGHAASLDAIDECEEALSSYAQAGLACSVLALRLREVRTAG